MSEPRWRTQERLFYGDACWLSIGYCSYPKEYRVRVFEGGRSKPELDYFTDDPRDAKFTAQDMKRRLMQ